MNEIVIKPDRTGAGYLFEDGIFGVNMEITRRGIFGGLCAHGLPVLLRQLHARGFPGRAILKAGIIQLHIINLPFCSESEELRVDRKSVV